jgi:hypothetical protein
MSWALPDGTTISDQEVTYQQGSQEPMAFVEGRWHKVTRSENGYRPQRRTSFTAAELMAAEFPGPRYAVPGLIAEGLNFFAGAPKMGKSWFALNLSWAVSSGGYALGKIGVEKGEALYLALEDPPRRLQQRFGMLLQSAPIPHGLHFETEWERLADGGTNRLRDWLAAHPSCRLVVVDVFAQVRHNASERADRYAADYAAMEPLKQLADDHNVAMLVLHHTRKANAEDYVDTVSGTNGLAGAADAVLVMKRSRGQHDAELLVTGRDIEERNLALRFDPQVGTWTMLGDAEEFQMGDTRRRVLTCLSLVSQMSPKETSDQLGITPESARQTLKRMADDGHIKANGDGTYSAIPTDPLSHLSQSHASPGDSVTEVTPLHRRPE